MKIPWYVPVWVEEAARAAFIAVGGYIVGAIVAGTIEPTRESIGAALPGLLAVAWAAIRTALNATPLTPPDATDTPLAPAPEPPKG